MSNLTQKISKVSFLQTYYARLLINNFIYIVAFVAFIVIAISFVPLQIRGYLDERGLVDIRRDEVDKLQIRLNAIDVFNDANIDNLLLVINTIYPSEEDRFSIFDVINNMERLTGISVAESTSPFEATTTEEGIEINVSGKGDLVAVRNLLNNYYYKYGRLMTLKSITYNPRSEVLNFTVLIHSREFTIGSNEIAVYNEGVLQGASDINDYFVSNRALFSNESADDAEVSTEYNPRQNPFQ